MNNTTTPNAAECDTISQHDRYHLSVFAAKHVCKGGWRPEQARQIVPMTDAAFAELTVWYRRMEVTGEFSD